MQANYDIKLAQDVIRIRFSQLIVNEKYKAGEFVIPIHLALGHEAIAVAVAKNMGAADLLVASHRNIHYNLARIETLKPQLDEYFLKENGLAKGCLGSMNLANERKGIIYTSSILANNLGVAAGVAMAQKVKESKGVVFVVTGDGGMEEGGFYEALEFLSSHNLACIVIVENNGWSLATRINERRCDIDLQKMCSSVGIKFESLTGNSVYEYAEKIRELRQFAAHNAKCVCVETHLSTLGSWRLKTVELPDGKYINYHAGPAPSTSLSEWPVLVKSNEDPVYALCRYFDETTLKKLSGEILQSLKADIK